MENKKSQKCNDKNCPKHGNISTRGRVFFGTVISAKMHDTVTVEWERRFFIKKYERYEKRRSKVKAHVPKCMKIKEGDVVKIMECRPLSKTKNFVVVEGLGQERGFIEKMEAREESKVPAKENNKEEIKEEDVEESEDETHKGKNN